VIARAIVSALLGRVRAGRIEIVGPGGRRAYGPRESALDVTVRVHDDSFWRALARGSRGLGESYAAGSWDCDDLVTLVRIAAREAPRLDRGRAPFAPLRNALTRVPRNTRARARRHVAAHYDLGNELFALFLDETMTYSCGVFEEPDVPLREAQQAKLDLVCRKLRLHPGDHLLEIGGGWGSLALHAATHYGCMVTTATLSREQHAVAMERVLGAGLGDRVDVVLRDYRELRGLHTKLASIEMVEAVGWQYFDTFFARCSELLQPDGLALLQAITIDDGAYEVEKGSRSFANELIFPGGCLPSREVIRRTTERQTDMRILGFEDMTAGYPPTLRHWRERWLAADTERLGADRHFRRLFEFYFSWCEGGFLERRIQTVQALMAKPGYRSSRVNILRDTASSSAAGPREASLASASRPPGPST
jgi:cyclopropane-fatty-acyl-phospholipid synthase